MRGVQEGRLLTDLHFCLLACRDVAPDTVIDRLPLAGHNLGRDVDVPESTIARALQRFEIGRAVLQHRCHSTPSFRARFPSVHVQQGQLRKLVAGVSQLLMRGGVETDEPQRLRMDDHDAVGRPLEQHAVAFRFVPDGLLQLLASRDVGVVSMPQDAAVGQRFGSRVPFHPADRLTDKLSPVLAGPRRQVPGGLLDGLDHARPIFGEDHAEDGTGVLKHRLGRHSEDVLDSTAAEGDAIGTVRPALELVQHSRHVGRQLGKPGVALLQAVLVLPQRFLHPLALGQFAFQQAGPFGHQGGELFLFQALQAVGRLDLGHGPHLSDQLDLIHGLG